MLAYFEDKRAELVEEIADCERELERAKGKLEFLDEIIADAQAYAQEVAEETETATEEATETATNNTQYGYPV